MNLDHLPMQPAWVRAWAAANTHKVTYTLANLRDAAAAMPPTARALCCRYPRDSILRCGCGGQSCTGILIVCGIATADGEPMLLVREGPNGDPQLRRDADLEVLTYGGGLTPRLFEVLASAPLGVC